MNILGNLRGNLISCYQKQHLRINAVLLFIFLVIALDLQQVVSISKHFGLAILSSSHLGPVAKISNILRDSIYVSALCIAAVWTYYTFIKGRTFVPRLNISIDHREQQKGLLRFVILRVKVENIGRSKARVSTEKISVEYGYVQDGCLTYGLSNDGFSFLDEHLSGNEFVYFEPGGISTVDVCLPVSFLERDPVLSKMPDVLRVKVEFVCEGRVFREIAIFDFGASKGGN